MRCLLSSLVLLLSLCLVSACDTGGAPTGLLGKPAPALSIPDASPGNSPGTSTGNPLASLRGRVVVLNFWASWCAPCLAEFPSLTALQQQLPGVVVYAVSFDRDPEAYTRFLRVHRITLRTALDTTGRSNQAFGTTRPPETYVIDRNGIVRRRFIGAQDWTSPEIETYLRALQ